RPWRIGTLVRDIRIRFELLRIKGNPVARAAVHDPRDPQPHRTLEPDAAPNGRGPCLGNSVIGDERGQRERLARVGDPLYVALDLHDRSLVPDGSSHHRVPAVVEEYGRA